jgi:hypothetical protein
MRWLDCSQRRLQESCARTQTKSPSWMEVEDDRDVDRQIECNGEDGSL